MSELLHIYLNDHLAGSTAGVELARRAAGQNAGSELGDFLERLVEEIERDREALEQVMTALDAGKDRLKGLVAWTGEKIGRLKLNGRLLGYSPLSRLEELEILSLGIEGKRLLWQALRAVADEDERLPAAELDRLLERAESQRAELERHRLEAALAAFATA